MAKRAIRDDGATSGPSKLNRVKGGTTIKVDLVSPIGQANPETAIDVTLIGRYDNGQMLISHRGKEVAVSSAREVGLI